MRNWVPFDKVIDPLTRVDRALYDCRLPGDSPSLGFFRLRCSCENEIDLFRRSSLGDSRFSGWNGSGACRCTRWLNRAMQRQFIHQYRDKEGRVPRTPRREDLVCSECRNFSCSCCRSSPETNSGSRDGNKCPCHRARSQGLQERKHWHGRPGRRSWARVGEHVQQRLSLLWLAVLWHHQGGEIRN
jgi:hypothetical protein